MKKTKKPFGTKNVIFLYIQTIVLTYLIFNYVNFNHLFLTIFIKLPLLFLPTMYLYSKERKGNQFTMYFGVPGTGKTTFGAYLYKKTHKKNPNKMILSNIPIKDTYILDKNDVGKYQIDNALILWDEISGDFDNRDFKTNFSNNSLMWFKKHRHYKTDIVMFSQSYEDADKKLRDLTTKLYIIKKSIFPFFIARRLIKKRIIIDEITKKPIDEFYFPALGRWWIFSPPLWKLFNSWDAPILPHKDFPKW